ncbi:MAG: hypothetical protein QXL51_00230 [Candidatus Aenigmatarchaeota archaeon]
MEEQLFLDTLYVERKKNDFDSPWYILYYGNLNCLRTLLANLSLKFNFICWQPSFKKRVWKNRKWIETRRLVFPGYAFVKTDDIVNFDITIRDEFKNYYVYFLKFENKFATLGIEEEMWVRNLEQLLEKMYLNYIGFLPGDIVCYKDLGMGTFIGEVLEVDSKRNKVKVKFNLFSNREMITWVDFDQIELIQRESEEEIAL